jgi:hypothetical protein
LAAQIQAELVENTAARGWKRFIRTDWRSVNLWRLSLVGTVAVFVLVLANVFLPSTLGPAEDVHQTQVEPRLQLTSDDIDGLARMLNENPTRRPVIVYPADYATVLAEHIEQQVAPLTLPEDPASASIQASLKATLPPSGLVEVIMVDRGTGDADHQVRVTLEQSLYRLDDPQTFGDLERNPFVIGPEEAVLKSIGAHFENGVELVKAGVFDELRPGSPLRFALEWRLAKPVDDSVVMFAHLTRDGLPLAQRDAVPGNGLFPVKNWGVGEVVREQKAIAVPEHLPSGKYELRVGIYSADSGRRYDLVEPMDGTYVIIEQFTVATPIEMDKDI